MRGGAELDFLRVIIGQGLGVLRWGVWEAFAVRIGAGRYGWCIGQPAGGGEVTGAVVTAVLFFE